MVLLETVPTTRRVSPMTSAEKVVPLALALVFLLMILNCVSMKVAASTPTDKRLPLATAGIAYFRSQPSAARQGPLSRHRLGLGSSSVRCGSDRLSHVI